MVRKVAQIIKIHPVDFTHPVKLEVAQSGNMTTHITAELSIYRNHGIKTSYYQYFGNVIFSIVLLDTQLD